MLFRTIVLALDGSEGSRRAAPIAMELAKRDNARLVLVHVEEWIAAKGGAPLHANEEEIRGRSSSRRGRCPNRGSTRS